MKRNIFKKIRLSKSNKKSNKQIYESFPLNTDNIKNSFKKKSRKKCSNIKKKYILFNYYYSSDCTNWFNHFISKFKGKNK